MPTVQTIVTLDETEATTLAGGLSAPAEAVKIDVRAHLAQLKQSLPSMKSFKHGLQVNATVAAQCQHALDQERELLSQLQTLIGETPNIQAKLEQIDAALRVCTDIVDTTDTQSVAATQTPADSVEGKPNAGWTSDSAA